MLHRLLMLTAVAAATLAFAAGGADARPGQRCGGKIQITCGAGEWCDPTPAHCAPGARGRCVKVPQFCTDIFKPVCGCNGHTFGNDCFRIMDKMALKHKGAC